MEATVVLTPTEDLICRYKVHGLQRKEISVKMARSENTLLVHNKHIHSKLHVNNDVEVVVWYIENVLNIDIKRIIQVGILLLILVPSILMDESKVVRAQRTTHISRSIRNRRNETNYSSNYLLAL